MADELRISQVIYNLVNNAVNHCGDDKTVIVTQKLLENGVVRLEVTDHGEGIPPDKLPYIWDRYYKVDKEHKRGVIGTGLGLSIVKGILDSHNQSPYVSMRTDYLNILTKNLTAQSVHLNYAVLP